MNLNEDLLSKAAVMNAGFDYWNSTFDYSRNGGIHTVYLGQLHHQNGSTEEIQTNLAIIEVERLDSKSKRTRIDWYFGTFEGEHDLCVSNLQNLIGEVQKLVTKRNRIAVRSLELKIRKLVRELKEIE